jgi:protein-tyrosine phosphatase
MIDIHFHCLPGIDDGPSGWDESVALCRAAAAQGTTTIVATPHVLREAWINDDPQARDALTLKLNTLLGGTPAVLPGCEYFLASDAVDLVERGEWGPLTTLNRSRYLLVEFPPGELLAGTDGILHELSLIGITPVIAHPERNRIFSEDPAALENLVERGALVQVTAASVLGEFGIAPLTASNEFFRRGLVHLVASDAHSLARRPPVLGAARRRIRRDWGDEVETGIFESNALAVIRSRPLPWRAAGASAPVAPRGGRPA